MIETISYKGRYYPALQAEGFAAQWAFPFAKRLLSGAGFDIGCNRQEWCLPGAVPIDPAMNEFDAYNIPAHYAMDGGADYIFSSHCLEHLKDWVGALDYWHTRLKRGGVLFLYLPHMDLQEYWHPVNNRKHLHYLNPKVLSTYFNGRAEFWKNVFISGADLNCSFYAIAEKI